MDWVKEKMHQARLQRNQIQAQGAVTNQGNNLRHDPDETITRFYNFFTLTHKLSWLAGGMALGSLIVIMVWKTELVEVGNDLRANDLPGDVPAQHRNLVELPSQFSTTDTEGLRKDVILLTEQVQILATSVSDLKIKLLQIHAATDSIAALGYELASDISHQQGTLPSNVTQLKTLPSLAAGKGNVSTSDGKDADKLVDATSTPLVAIKEITPTASEVQTQKTIIGNGPWVINLASLPHKADAERFVANAESKGVGASLYQATVRGKNYWRVHVPGFTTAAEANAKASLIKEKLGLKDAWVAKR
jgi:cell division septation protein DedD